MPYPTKSTKFPNQPPSWQARLPDGIKNCLLRLPLQNFSPETVTIPNFIHLYNKPSTFLSHKGEHIDTVLQGCLEGKQSAQLEVYNRYYRAMYNTSLRIVKKGDEAEDVMQESFLKAFTKLHTFKGEVAFGAWLKRIVVNNSIQHYRKQQKKKEVDLEDVMYKVEDNEGRVPDHAFTELKAQKVMETMDRLKDNYRISLTLHLIEGYDYEEISQIMDISYANCRTTISRAKESLRKKLIPA